VDRNSSAGRKGSLGVGLASRSSSGIRQDGPKSSQESIPLSTTSTVDDEAFHTPPEASTPRMSRTSTTESAVPHSPLSSGTAAAPPSTVPSRALHGHNLSVNSNYSHSSYLQPRAPRSSFDQLPSPSTSDFQECVTSEDEAGQTRLEGGNRQESVKSNRSRPVTPVSPNVNKDKENHSVNGNHAKSPDSSKGHRRSLQHPLRDGEGRSHFRHISRKGHRSGSKDVKDGTHDGNVLSASTSASFSASGSPNSAMKGVAEDESTGSGGLQRHKGSFTIHGKKASVVTFGGDWTNNAEETLERIKAATSPIHDKGRETSRSALNRIVSSAITDGDGENEGQDDETIKGLETETLTTPTAGFRFRTASGTTARSNEGSSMEDGKAKQAGEGR